MRLRPLMTAAVALALLVPAGAHAQGRARPTAPTARQLAQASEALPRPWTLTFVEHDGRRVLVRARRGEVAWQLHEVFDENARPLFCEAGPCAWPASFGPTEALFEPPALSPVLRRSVAYARTLMTFEGPLAVSGEPVDARFEDQLPEEAWAMDSPRRAPNLVPFLDSLRRYHPMGRCSMDRRPQQVARMRATAAAQAGRTGWAVEGWIDTVAYFRSERMAWSSFGQSHPEGHLELLEMVRVDPLRLMLGLSIALPDHPPVIGLADARRIAPDLGPGFERLLRGLVGDRSLDAYNRARLFAIVANLPLESDPQWAALPDEARALLTHWSR